MQRVFCIVSMPLLGCARAGFVGFHSVDSLRKIEEMFE